jgi:hypothetical protein
MEVMCKDVIVDYSANGGYRKYRGSEVKGMGRNRGES